MSVIQRRMQSQEKCRENKMTDWQQERKSAMKMVLDDKSFESEKRLQYQDKTKWEKDKRKTRRDEKKEKESPMELRCNSRDRKRRPASLLVSLLEKKQELEKKQMKEQKHKSRIESLEEAVSTDCIIGCITESERLFPEMIKSKPL